MQDPTIPVNKPTVIAGRLKTPLSLITRARRQEIRKGVAFNTDLVDKYRTHH